MKSSIKSEKREPCKDPKCLVGKTEKGGNCRTNEVLYEVKCKDCGDLYPGETARNAHTRGIEHVDESESQNEKVQEKSVLLRHMKEKHEGRRVEFEMKVLKSFQHNPLARQCAEAIRIKNTAPNKRINNKEEYHQPGDVQVEYNKNINEKFKKKKKENLNIEAEKAQPTILKKNNSEVKKNNIEVNIGDFLKEMRKKNEEKELNKEKEVIENCVSEEEPIPSTQDIIEDSRERRTLKEKGKTHLECEMCPYKSQSKYIMKRHIKTRHEEGNETRVENKAEKEGTSTQDEVFKSNPGTGIIEERAPSNTLENNEVVASKEVKSNKYIPKRIACELCDKKFNKNDTFKKHMEKIHKKKAGGIGSAVKSSENTVYNKDIPPILKLLNKMTLRSRELTTKESSNAPASIIDKEL